jgi:hypothetical protein
MTFAFPIAELETHPQEWPCCTVRVVAKSCAAQSESQSESVRAQDDEVSDDVQEIIID